MRKEIENLEEIKNSIIKYYLAKSPPKALPIKLAINTIKNTQTSTLSISFFVFFFIKLHLIKLYNNFHKNKIP